MNRSIRLQCSAVASACILAGCGPTVEEVPFQNPRSFSCGRNESALIGATCQVIERGSGVQPTVLLTLQMRPDDPVNEEAWSVAYSGLSTGTQSTPYAGSNERPVLPDTGETFVGLGSWCDAGSSWYTPEPCSVELKEIEFEEGAGPEKAETGEPILVTRVRMVVACPDALISPGSYDYGPSEREFSPSDFEVEAVDCEYDGL